MDETRTGTTEIKLTVTETFADALEKAAMLKGMSLQGYVAVALIEALRVQGLLYKWQSVTRENEFGHVDYINTDTNHDRAES